MITRPHPGLRVRIAATIACIVVAAVAVDAIIRRRQR